MTKPAEKVMDIKTRKLKESVEKSYAEFTQKFQGWPNRYNIARQTSKMLSDYALLSKIELREKKVLNVGCSEPDDEVHFADIVGEWHILDINEKVIQKANKLVSETLPPQLYSKLKFIVGDTTKLDLKDECYDIVISFSTIDHIPGQENRRKAIREMCRVLKQGGYLIVTVPNRWDFYYSYHSNKLQRENKAIFGYEYQISPLELKKMFISNRLKIIDCASTNFNPCSYLDRILKKLWVGKILIHLGTRFGYLAQKVDSRIKVSI